MPTLPVDFSLTLNYRTQRVMLHDTTLYNVGVAAGITGIVSITQPDRVNRAGDFTTPDTLYTGGALRDGSVELRLDAAGNPQQGTYTVTYTVRHSAYTESTVTKTFTLRYQRPVAVLSASFDVFTPLLLVQDVTDYTANGFAAPVTTRAWSVNVGSIGVRTGNTATLDLGLNANYYDAAYTGTLQTLLSYTSLTYPYLTLLDTATADVAAEAYAPLSYTQLKGYLSQIKLRFDALTDCRKTTAARDDFEYASALLSLIRQRICEKDFTDLWRQVDDFMNVYYLRVSQSREHTHVAIAAYAVTDVNCGGGSSGGTGGGGTTPTPGRFDSLTYTATGDETTFIPNVGGKTLVGQAILAVITARAIPMGVVSSGVPAADAIRFTASLGRIDLDPDQPMNPGEKMTFLYTDAAAASAIATYLFTATATAATALVSVLASKTILAVISGRAVPMSIVTAGTPAADEIKFTQSTGRVDVDAAIPFTPGEKMLFIYS